MRALKSSPFLLTLLLVALLGAAVVTAQDDDTPPLPDPPATEEPDADTNTTTDEAVDVPLPITGDVTYAVRAGDTLDTIGSLFDVSVLCIRQNNPEAIDSAGILPIGTNLLISNDCPQYEGADIVRFPRVDAPGQGQDGTYVVRIGDTLDTIGQQLNVAPWYLAEENDITNPRAISPGDVLTFAEDAPAYSDLQTIPPRVGTSSANADSPNTATAQDAMVEGDEYIVQPNDTYDTIGQELNVSAEQLALVNGIAPRDLLAGQILIIPEDAAPYGFLPVIVPATADVDGETYVIQRGDTLEEIALSFNVSVVALRQANDIQTARDVQPGREIIIPDDAPPFGVFASIDQPAGAQVADGEVYIIQPNDTLDGIAAQFNVDTMCLIEANGVTNVRNIRPGQSVGVPADCPPYTGFDFVPTTAPTNTNTDTDTTGEDADESGEETDTEEDPAG